jgi:hypothetical protein
MIQTLDCKTYMMNPAVPWCYCFQHRPTPYWEFYKRYRCWRDDNWLRLFVARVTFCYTGRFIMFSVVTNIYNKKSKGPNLMELFTATGKRKKFFLTTRDVRCVHHGWHGTHRYDIQVLATHASTWVHRYSLLLQWSVAKGTRGAHIEHL